MKRYDKKTMNTDSVEYDQLLEAELGVWRKYSSGREPLSTFDEVKNTHAYQTYRKGTVEKELEFISELAENIHVLELGGADGWLTNEIIKLSNVSSVTSIDLAIEDNKNRYNPKAVTLQGDLNKIENILFERKYDCIITHGTLHHLTDPHRTLIFCIENLLNINGLLIINDTWVLKPLQLKLNASAYLLLNRIPHSILDYNFKELFRLSFKVLPRIITNTAFAESIAHAHHVSPFESISSADDYIKLFSQKTSKLDLIYFKRKGSLPGLQNSWMSSPTIIKKIIQRLDDFLIEKEILPGDYHISVMRRK